MGFPVSPSSGFTGCCGLIDWRSSERNVETGISGLDNFELDKVREGVDFCYSFVSKKVGVGCVFPCQLIQVNYLSAPLLYHDKPYSVLYNCDDRSRQSKHTNIPSI